MERTTSEQSEEPFHILALSGGGFRGLYTATVLAELEEKFGEPVGRHFDLICGTSVGGIIGLAAAHEIPMAEIRDLFKEKGASIFHNKETLRSRLRKYFRSKFSQEGLKEALTSTFQERILGEAKHRVLIPTVNYTKGSPQVFKTPHHPTFERDWKLPIVDIALATSAAPVFLPMAKLEGRGIYVDGGLFANAPGLLGVHEAIHFLDIPEQNIHLLSIGTMSSALTMRSGSRLNPGILGWGEDLFSLMISSQESMSHYLLQHRLQGRYIQIDVTPSKDQDRDLALDLASQAAIDTLTFRADDSFQAAIGKSEFTPFLHHMASPPDFWHGPNATRTQP